MQSRLIKLLIALCATGVRWKSNTCLPHARPIMATPDPAAGVQRMPVSCAAQILSQRGIVHALRRDHATNAHGDESKGTLASLGAVQIGLKYLKQLLQHVAVGLLHDIAPPA